MLTKLDELYLTHHYYLSATDECYFAGEYTAGRGYAHSQTNNLILNLKKSVDRQGLPEWKYKVVAIRQAATLFRESLTEEFLGAAMFVPTPPSKASTDALYDDRMVQVCHLLGGRVDVRELVYQETTMEDAHSAQERPSPDSLYENYVLRRELLDPRPVCVAVVDDVLTTGAHFVAMRRVLGDALPGVPVIGLFVARRVPE